MAEPSASIAPSVAACPQRWRRHSPPRTTSPAAIAVSRHDVGPSFEPQPKSMAPASMPLPPRPVRWRLGVVARLAMRALGRSPLAFQSSCTSSYRGVQFSRMSTMTVSEARAPPELLDRVAAGEEVTITRHGQAVAVVMRPDVLRVRRADRALASAASVRDLLVTSRRSAPPLQGLSEARR